MTATTIAVASPDGKTLTPKLFVRLFSRYMRAYNPGPFGIPGNLAVKDAIAKDRLFYRGDADEPVAAAIANVMSAPSRHTDFAYRLMNLSKGDLFIEAFAARADMAPELQVEEIVRLLNTIITQRGKSGQNMWLQVHTENPQARWIASHMGFKYAGTKVDAYSTLKDLWVIANPDLPPPYDPWTGDWDKATLTCLDRNAITSDQVTTMLRELDDFTQKWHEQSGANAFADHYSTYNVKNTWSAFALRGFQQDDPTCIVKPSEMPKDWKKAHPEAVDWTIGDTEAAKLMPSVMQVVKEQCARLGTEPERIRVMRLTASGGELARHSDITDRNAGTADGQVCRFHIPLRTSAMVEFQMWDDRGNRYTRHMPEGSMWYLDQRKPHRAVNKSPDVERIHVVWDAYVNDAMRERLAQAWRDEREGEGAPDLIVTPSI